MAWPTGLLYSAVAMMITGRAGAVLPAGATAEDPMCVTIPREVVRVWADRAEVLIDGKPREVVCAGLDGLAPGDYVLLHADAAIERLTADEAREALAFLAAMEALLDDPGAVDDLLAFGPSATSARG